MNPNANSCSRGFTLIELMIVIVIVGILASIAVPSYKAYIEKSRRSAARSVLLNILAKQENYFADLKRYAGSASDLGYPGNPFYIDSNGAPQATLDSSKSTYKLSISQQSNFDFTATAAIVGLQNSDSDCAEFSINNFGTKSATNADCW